MTGDVDHNYELLALRWMVISMLFGILFIDFRRFLFGIVLFLMLFTGVRLWRWGDMYRKAYKNIDSAPISYDGVADYDRFDQT